MVILNYDIKTNIKIYPFHEKIIFNIHKIRLDNSRRGGKVCKKRARKGNSITNYSLGQLQGSVQHCLPRHVSLTDTTVLKHTLKSSRPDWMLSDEDSRFLESWKERGESRYRLCCLFTLWARIEVTLSFEIFVLRLMQCILCLILYVTFFITLFLFDRIFICRIKFCGILYCIYIYICTWRVLLINFSYYEDLYVAK